MPVRGHKTGQALKFPSGAKVRLSKYLAELATLENADRTAVLARRKAIGSTGETGATGETESDDSITGIPKEKADDFAKKLSDFVSKASGSINSTSAEAVEVTVESGDDSSDIQWNFRISISSEANRRMHNKPSECRQLAQLIDKTCQLEGFDFDNIVINIR